MIILRDLKKEEFFNYAIIYKKYISTYIYIVVQSNS